MVKKLNALIENDLAKQLYHALVDEDRSYAEWLRCAIAWYLAQKSAGVNDPFAFKGEGKPKKGGQAK
jgi:hypothetical protein